MNNGGVYLGDTLIATKQELATKQDTLVSGTNIKTIGGESLLGSGDISDLATKTELNNLATKTELNNKADDNAVVHKSGDTMTGSLQFGLSQNLKPIVINMDNTTGSASENLQDIDFRLNGKRISMIRSSHQTSGINKLEFFIYDNDGVSQKNCSIAYNPSTGKVTYSPVQLITTYVSGTSGYNIWSNGYCEQWGKSTCSSKSGNTVQLAKTYKNTDYNIETDFVGNSTGDIYNYFKAVINVNTSSFVWYLTMGSSLTVNGKIISWKTSGYLAEDQY